jgi:hypothetical protein
MTDLDQFNHSFADWIGTGKNFILLPGGVTDTGVDATGRAQMDIAKNYWNYITWVMFDEATGYDATGLQNLINQWKSLETEYGLSHKPILFNTFNLDPGGNWTANNIDAVGFDCYMDPSTQNDADVVTQLNNKIDAALALTGSKEMMFTIMGYNRNGAWTNITSLRDLQTPPYLKAHDNPRVTGLLIFSYGRDSGSMQDARLLPSCIKNEQTRIYLARSHVSPQPPTISCGGIPPPPPAPLFSAAFACGVFCRYLECHSTGGGKHGCFPTFSVDN